jgi:ubiquinol-cytochrome c reductase cytochrome c subunit
MSPGATIRKILRALPVACLMTFLMMSGARAQPPSGIVRPTTEPAHPTTELGAELFAGNCASCHGIAGAGITSPRPGAGAVLGEGPSLRGVGAIAPDFYLRLGLMPLSDPKGQPQNERVLLSDKEIRSIVKYVASLGHGPPIPHPDVRTASISEGLNLFTEHCAGCHQIEGRGGFVTGAKVPPLQNLSATEVAEAVRIGPYLMPRFTRRQISDDELAAIVKYVQSTNTPSNRGGWGIGNVGPIPEGIVAWWIAAPLLIAICLALGRRFRS